MSRRPSRQVATARKSYAENDSESDDISSSSAELIVRTPKKQQSKARAGEVAGAAKETTPAVRQEKNKNKVEAKAVQEAWKTVQQEEEEEDDDDDEIQRGKKAAATATTPKKTPPRKKAVKKAVESPATEKLKTKIEDAAETAVQAAREVKAGVKRKVKAEEEEEQEEGKKAKAETGDRKPVKKRKTKGENEEMSLATRTAVGGLKKAMYIGAHVSGAGGVHNAIPNAHHIGANAFALFLKSQRQWTSKPLDHSVIASFLSACKHHSYDATSHIVPHGSYLVNLAQSAPDKAKQAYDCFLDDLQRCESLGIGLYNFHPGARLDSTRDAAIARIASQLNSAHAATNGVITLLENMAGGGTVLGSTFEDLADIIALVDDKTRVGVCIDTCHAFAAGYDLRSPEAFEATMAKFDQVVGLRYVKALHVNDSKAPLGSRRDLHANIGTGFLGLRAFHNVVNFAGFEGLPMVLETPIDRNVDGKTVEDKSIWAGEIKLLEGLIGRDVESEGFKEDEKRLWESGKAERDRVHAQVAKKSRNGNKKINDMFKPTPKTKPKGDAKGKKKDEESASEVDEEW